MSLLSSTSAKSLLEFPLLFEISWEVANKSGGIYTVIRSKVPVTVEEYGERYCCIGPYVSHAAAVEFEERPPPKPYAEAAQRMQAQGIVIHFGRWVVPGNPHAVLFELGPAWARLEGWRRYVSTYHTCLMSVQ